MLAGMEAASGVADVLMGPCVVRTTGTTIPAPLNLQTTTGCVRSGCTHTEISSNLSLMDHAALCHQPPLFKSDVMSVASATSNFGGTYKTIGPYQQQQQVQPPRSQQHPQHSIVKDIVMEPVCPNAVQPSSIDNNEMVVDENQPQSHTIPPTTISQNQQLQPRIQVAVAASSTATYCQPPPVIPLTELSEKVGDNQSMQMEL